MKQIWVVLIGEDYSHSYNDSAFANKDGAIERATELAKKMNLTRHDGAIYLRPYEIEYAWSGSGYYIQVEPLNYFE